MIKNIFLTLVAIGIFSISCAQEVEDVTQHTANSVVELRVNPIQNLQATSALLEGNLAVYLYDQNYQFISMYSESLPLSSPAIGLEVDKEKEYNIVVLSLPKGVKVPAPQAGDTPDKLGYIQVDYYDENKNNSIYTSSSDNKWGCIKLEPQQLKLELSLSTRFAQVKVPEGVTKLRLTNKRHEVSLADISPREVESWQGAVAEQIINVMSGEAVYISPDLMWGPTTQEYHNQTLRMEAHNGTEYLPVVYIGTSMSLRGGHNYEIYKSDLGYTIGVPDKGNILTLGALNIKHNSHENYKTFFPHQNCDIVAFSEMGAPFHTAMMADNNQGWRSNKYQTGYGAYMQGKKPVVVAPYENGAIFSWRGLKIGVIAYHGWWYPYGPYQMNGITFKEYPPTNDVNELVSTNTDQPSRIEHKAALYSDEQWMIDQGADIVVIMGDYNEPAAVDYSAQFVDKGFKKLAVPWPFTTELADKGYTDCYREVKPDAILFPGNTWSPEGDPHGIYDRIDFIWYKVTSSRVHKVSTLYSYTIGNAFMGDIDVPGWPYDHAGVIAALDVKLAE